LILRVGRGKWSCLMNFITRCWYFFVKCWRVRVVIHFSCTWVFLEIYVKKNKVFHLQTDAKMSCLKKHNIKIYIFISKRAELKLYYSVIRPIVTYSCKTWILKETIINKLLVFERKILRKIFGWNKENGICR
jgi:hypothetical protein